MFISAPNWSNSSTISALSEWHARCNNDQPRKHVIDSLVSVIFRHASGSCCWCSSAWQTTSPCFMFTIFEVDVTIRRYTSRTFIPWTACQILVETEGFPSISSSRMISDFSTYWLRKHELQQCLLQSKNCVESKGFLIWMYETYNVKLQNWHTTSKNKMYAREK